MNLQSKWEWLSQQKEEPPSQAPQKRPRPPPIAPKPKLFRRVSVGETNELPVSFDQVDLNNVGGGVYIGTIFVCTELLLTIP